MSEPHGIRDEWVRRQHEHGNEPRAVLMKGLPALLNDSIDHWHRDVLRAALAQGPRGRVLDVGCGFGRLADELPSLGHTPFGMDFTPGFCRGFATQHGPAVCGDQVRPPFADGVFAGAYSVTSLMYLDPARARDALHELDRCLAPGATVLVLEPCREFNTLVRTLLPGKRSERLAMPGFDLVTLRDLMPGHWQPLGSGTCHWLTAALPVLILATRWPRFYRWLARLVRRMDRPCLGGHRARGRISLYRWVACRKPA